LLVLDTKLQGGHCLTHIGREGQAGERGIEGELVIEFHIAKDGRLEHIALQRSSGVPLLDTSAMNAIKFAETFPPVPDELLSESSLAAGGDARGRTRRRATKPPSVASTSASHAGTLRSHSPV